MASIVGLKSSSLLIYWLIVWKIGHGRTIYESIIAYIGYILYDISIPLIEKEKILYCKLEIINYKIRISMTRHGHKKKPLN